MPLPRWVARFNKRVTNRILEPVARRASNFAVVHHRGRTSGRHYRTPVNYFDADTTVVVALTYGPSADWARNVLAGPASFEYDGQVHEIEDAQLVGRDAAWPALPRTVRVVLRLLRVRNFVELRLARPNASQ